jgi:hypothetical protein
LGLAVCAVLGGARSFTAIAEWAADADKETLARLGVAGTVPSESTFRRTLQRLDAGAFDDLAGAWAARRTAPGPGGRRVIAVDGKTLRGSGHGSDGGRHLLAALDRAHGAVLGQVEVGAKTNEIPMFSALLGPHGHHWRRWSLLQLADCAMWLPSHRAGRPQEQGSPETTGRLGAR